MEYKGNIHIVQLFIFVSELVFKNSTMKNWELFLLAQHCKLALFYKFKD